MLHDFLDFEWEWIIRIVCATLMGAIIGYERHARLKDAGIRTHAIVAMAAALLMIVSKYGFDPGTADEARIAAQVVSGVGFLGAGIIFVRNDLILGLTTAAGIWATSALGLCFGAGLYVIGFISGILIVAIQLLVYKFFNSRIIRTSFALRITMKEKGSLSTISDTVHQYGYTQSDNTITAAEDEGKWLLRTTLATTKNTTPNELLTALKELEDVEDVKLV